ncbi:beta-1,3-galactosyl-O-glycosyl-glycoprotein beta-1,6-N-acetylglucosaminyltransferase-like [Haliotis rufescens]|uniref:beta-1,3-galactosyl-O-glycosyl-glycoprotein beta-1,6-N-acetylglucosaminyltransferase-like n=1 Tax=Haliotis rufescens TaxID=6454 RepID=UPI00201F36D3|nr:beta-1,3-galactosyl-O-glycosyl-glycoprotein beta-1,6-N-acetylglucosaminyltransferase-like [Haliotis rufescens]
MPSRCVQLLLPIGVTYTLLVLSIWNALIFLGPIISSKLQAKGDVTSRARMSVITGLSKPPMDVGVPVRFKLLTVLKFHPHKTNATIVKTGLNDTDDIVIANKTESSSGSDDCTLNFEVTDQCISLVKGADVKMKPIIPRPHCTLGNLLKNCSRYRHARGYEDKPVTSQELEYPLAFAIKMHTSPEQAEQLLRTIYRPHNVYCIHVDQKAEAGVFDTMKSIARCLDNVEVIDDRTNVVYMSSATIHAEMKCMKRLMESKVKWKYYINLAGQEFPLRTNLEIVMMLKRLNGANDIESYDHPRFQEWRFKKKFLITDGKLEQTNVDKEPFGYDIQMSKGSAYGMFKREFVQFVLTDDVARKLINWLNDTSSPEENLWATLNTLPWAPGGTYVETRQTFNTHASRALIWNWDRDVCHGTFVRSVCVFGSGDLKWLTSRPNVIANKFNNDLDPVPLDCLESWLHRRLVHPLLQTVDKHYIANLPHVKYYNNIDFSHLSTKYFQEKKRKWLKKHPWKLF